MVGLIKPIYSRINTLKARLDTKFEIIIPTIRHLGQHDLGKTSSQKH